MRNRKINNSNVRIQGIAGKQAEILGDVLLQFSDGKEHGFYVVDYLPRDLNLIVGQDWLRKNQFGLIQVIGKIGCERISLD